MEESFDISIKLSAGQKDFTVLPEDNGYTLKESGSIVAVLKEQEGRWVFVKGSYTESDAQQVGELIRQRKS